MPQMNEVLGVNERHQQSLLGLPGVTAVGVGYLEDASSNLTDEIGIVAYVSLDQNPASTGLPMEIEGVKVGIKRGSFVTSYPRSFDGESREGPPAGSVAIKDPVSAPESIGVKVEPMVGGISGNPDYWYWTYWYGTIGLVIKNAKGKAVILSNRHVICGKNPAVDDGVCQPARDSVFSDLAAKLVAWQMGDYVFGGAKYGIDAAIALPCNDRTATIGKIQGLADVDGIVDPVLGLDVSKSGFVSAVTHGKITVVNLNTRNEDGIVMSNQFVIRATNYPTPFSVGGDSGSGIIDNTNHKVAGLLWGGTADNKETVASPIAPVLTCFQCTIV